MIAKTREYACSEPNALTGFPATEEQKKEWLEKIKANGVKEGDEVLLVAGIKKDTVVKFSYENLCFSDIGVTSKDWIGGWFYLASEDKACKPLYYDFTDSEDGNQELEQKNAIVVSTTAVGAKIINILGFCGKGQNGSKISNVLVDDYSIEEPLANILNHESTTHRYLAFDSARDMYIYLTHLETISNK